MHAYAHFICAVSAACHAAVDCSSCLLAAYGDQAVAVAGYVVRGVICCLQLLL